MFYVSEVMSCPQYGNNGLKQMIWICCFVLEMVQPRVRPDLVRVAGGDLSDNMTQC